jgi:hypothetical protein
MADASADRPRSHDGPDRRKLVDLLRAERGEPERRKLPRFGDPVVVADDQPDADASGSR